MADTIANADVFDLMFYHKVEPPIGPHIRLITPDQRILATARRSQDGHDGRDPLNGSGKDWLDRRHSRAAGKAGPHGEGVRCIFRAVNRNRTNSDLVIEHWFGRSLRSPTMEDFEMLPGILDAGSSALLSSQRAPQSVRTVRSKKTTRVLFTAVCRVLRGVSMWHERTSDRHALARLDDHLLRDIGLTRADVERELMKPFWRE